MAARWNFCVDLIGSAAMPAALVRFRWNCGGVPMLFVDDTVLMIFRVVVRR